MSWRWFSWSIKGRRQQQQQQQQDLEWRPHASEVEGNCCLKGGLAGRLKNKERRQQQQQKQQQQKQQQH